MIPERQPRPYLNARSLLVARLADQVRGNAAAEAPAAWVAARPHAVLSAELIADIQVWRAATQVEPSICDPPDHPNPATPLESSNSNSTSGSPPQTPVPNRIGGTCSLQKPPAPQRTHSCQN
jgi:hypothetical protein